MRQRDKKPTAISRKKQRRIISDADARLLTIKEFLRKKWVLEEEMVDQIVRLVQHFGLQHEPACKPGTITRKVQQNAEKTEAEATLKTIHAHVRKMTPEALEDAVAKAKRVARMKVEADLYQTTRGDRLISRFPTTEDREAALRGCRRELEVTTFFQVTDRYLQEDADMKALKSRTRCLAGILCRAEGILPRSKPQLVKIEDRIRDRLRKAPPLDDFVYHWVLGREPEGWEPFLLTMPKLTVKKGDPPSHVKTNASGSAAIKAMQATRSLGVNILCIAQNAVSLECQRCGHVWDYTHVLAKPPQPAWQNCPNGCHDTA